MARKDPFREAFTRYKPALGLTIFFSFFTNLLLFVAPLYMLQIYDRVLQSRNENTLLMLTILAGALLALYGVMEFIRSRVLARAGMRFDVELAHPLFQRVIDRAPHVSKAESLQSLADIDRVRDFLSGQGLLVFCDAPWVPVFLGICFVFNPLLGIVATAGALGLFFLALLNEFLTRRTLREAYGAARETNEYASGSLVNAEVVQALGMEKAISGRWQERRHRMLDRHSVAGDRGGAILSASKFLRMSLQVAILGVGAWLVLKNQITPGIMIAASIMMGRALAPVEQSVAHWRTFVGARDAFGRLRKLFSESSEIAERTRLARPAGKLTVEGVVGRVPGGEKTVLAGINFSLEPGEVCAVIGPSGAGKSSLVRHLTGVWRPRAGHIRLDGSDFHHWDRETLGKLLGYVPQDVELFDGTVAENIARFGEQNSDLVLQAAQQAGAHELIQTFPEGYDTAIGEGGQHLSAGQRQRVALARALYGNPVLIVLDEPNSNLDSEGDEALVAAIRRARERKQTLVCVTHKTNILMLADKALVLRDGMQHGFGPASDLIGPAITRTAAA